MTKELFRTNSVGNKTRKSIGNFRKSSIHGLDTLVDNSFLRPQPISSFSTLLAVQNGDDTGSTPKDTASQTRKPEIHPDLGNISLKQRQGRKVW